MKVVHVVRQYLPSVGGMEEVVRNLAASQALSTVWKPTIVTLDRVFRTSGPRLPAMEVIEGVAVHRLAFSGSERYPLCPRVLHALRNADLVHVHAIDFFFDYLAWTHVWHRKPMLASTHGGFFHSGFAPRLKRLFFQTVTRTSALAYRRIVATSENDGDLFRAVVGPKRLRVIENGVDIDKFADAASPTLQPTLVYFGRWSVNKGLLDTLDTLAALCAQQPDIPWRLIIAGRAYDLDAEMLAAQAQMRGLTGRVTLVPEPGNAELRDYLGQASYYICQSRHEGFGIAPIEGMSAGLIPLLSAIPPFERLVGSARTGLLLDAPDAVSRAHQIGRLHQRHREHPGDFANDSARALRGAQAYAWSGVARQYGAQYHDVLDH